MEAALDEKDDSGADRSAAAKSQSVTFTSGLSKEELDKPKLQRIPTPYYEHLQQQTGAATGVGDSGAGGKGPAAGGKEPTEGACVASEPPAQTGPSSQTPQGAADSDDLGELRQAGPPVKSGSSTTRGRIQREFSMSRDDD